MAREWVQQGNFKVAEAAHVAGHHRELMHFGGATPRHHLGAFPLTGVEQLAEARFGVLYGPDRHCIQLLTGYQTGQIDIRGVRSAASESPLFRNLYSPYRTMDTARTTNPTEPLSQPRRGLFL